MINYPDTARINDKDAPWNLKESDYTVWQKSFIGACEACQAEEIEVNEDFICEQCFEPEFIDKD